MADNFTQVVQMAQTLERLLEIRYNAQGRGFHEKLSSVQSQIPENIQKKIRYIATMRNKAAHENVKVATENYKSIRKAYNEVLPTLSGATSFWTLLKRKLIVAGIMIAFILLWTILHR